MAQKMKIWTVLVGVKLQPDQHPLGRRTRRTNELLYEALRDQAETGIRKGQACVSAIGTESGLLHRFVLGMFGIEV